MNKKKSGQEKSLTDHGWETLREACYLENRGYLLEAVREAILQKHDRPLSKKQCATLTHDALAEIAFSLIIETNTMTPDYYHCIDKKGYYTIDLFAAIE